MEDFDDDLVFGVQVVARQYFWRKHVGSENLDQVETALVIRLVKEWRARRHSSDCEERRREASEMAHEVRWEIVRQLNGDTAERKIRCDAVDLESYADYRSRRATAAAARIEGIMRLNRLLASLPRRDATILKRRFGFGGIAVQTQKQIAESLGISRQRVDQIERRALEQIRAKWLRENNN
jgi:RNA polymerase sigma factor (sigma-70 family)